MAAVEMNPVFVGVKGKVGDLVFKRYGESLVMARTSHANGREPTAAQLAVRKRFTEAALYGRLALAQPAVRQAYVAAARERGKPITSLTIADFFNAPVVDKLDVSGYSGQTGETIMIQAHDDFEVMSVAVSISEAGGQAVEHGAATQDPPNSGRWIYTTTQTVSNVTGAQVTATAADRPGNLGTRTVVR